MEQIDYKFIDQVLADHACDASQIIAIMQDVQEWKQYSKSERSMMLPGIYVTPRKSTVDVKI